MQTYEEQKAFFDAQWPRMKEAAEQGGDRAVLEFLDALDDPLQRRVLALFARQGLALGEWEGKSLGVYARVVDGAIERFLEEGREAGDEERLRRAKELANVMSYNLAADLAECWPGDDAARTNDEFEAGLAAARRCVAWRRELEKGEGALAMALWAQGMHELSLGRTDDAVTSFEASLANAEAGAESAEDFSVVLGRGYLALARGARGDTEAESHYRGALSTFEAQAEDAARKDDAQFGIDQLETVRRKHLPAWS